MLTVNECVKIAQGACIDMFGRDFVNMHKEGFCSQRYLNPDTGLFEYTLLYAPLEPVDENDYSLHIQETPFDYYASVLVNSNTGAVVVNPDPSMTKLPRSSGTIHRRVIKKM